MDARALGINPYIRIKGYMVSLVRSNLRLAAIAGKTRGGPGRHSFDVRLVRADTDARREMAGCDFHKLRFHGTAGRNRIWTARMKPAARWRIDGRRDVALEYDALPPSLGDGIRHRDG